MARNGNVILAYSLMNQITVLLSSLQVLNQLKTPGATVLLLTKLPAMRKASILQ